MVIIGLTGGIASGKSTVSAELKKMGLPVFDADGASRSAVARGSRGLQLVAEAFGSSYLTEEGELNRPMVSELVFHDKEALKKLEAIIHQIVWQQAREFLDRCRAGGCRAAVLDVPLLIECGWHKYVDKVWLVAVSREQQIKRAMLRSGMTADEVEVRIAAQMPLAEKKQYADTVLDNSGPLEETLAAVHREVKTLLGGNCER